MILFEGKLLSDEHLDDGVSIMLLHEMIKEEPALAPYICVPRHRHRLSAGDTN